MCGPVPSSGTLLKAHSQVKLLKNTMPDHYDFDFRINVSVQLPALKKAGAKISNWEVMEKVKEMARPFTFPVFKVSKSSLEFIR